MKEKIPFNLEKYNTGEYDVVTREDRPARIICTDAKGSQASQPIVALVSYRCSRFSDSIEEIVHWYNNTGGYFDYGTNALDLFLIPKKKQEPRKEEKVNSEKFNKICVLLGLCAIRVYLANSPEQYEEQINTIAKKILEIVNDK